MTTYLIDLGACRVNPPTLDVTPDGNHFVTASDVGTLSPPILVFGWADEVREKVAAANRR